MTSDERFAYPNAPAIKGTAKKLGYGPESDTLDLHQAYFTVGNHKEFRGKGRTVKFAYDWRESLMNVARSLRSQLDVHAPKNARFVFLTHSMGGLVVRIALALKVLQPKNVDRIIHIGSPLQGAPMAFRSAYGKALLPMLSELTKLFHWKNADQFFKHLLDNVRTFPSIYQLMPPRRYPYLFYSPSHRSNPLDEPAIPDEFRKVAQVAHDLIEESDKIIVRNGVKLPRGAVRAQS